MNVVAIPFVKASACGMFGVRANEVVRVDLPLMSAP